MRNERMTEIFKYYFKKKVIWIVYCQKNEINFINI